MRLQSGRGWVCGLLILLASALAANAASLEDGFANPPRDAKPICFWMWINGNVTKEGITADLEDMKRVGIGGVLMFDVSLYQPPGPVRYGTDAWFDCVHHAIAECDRLGLEYGMIDSPGWSESGGPWVTVENSMKKIIWSTATVDGGKPIKRKLEQPETLKDFYRDVAVLAVPTEAKEADPVPTIESASPVDAKALVDGNEDTTVKFTTKDTAPTITFAYTGRTERRLLSIRVPTRSGQSKVVGQISVSDDGQKYRTVRPFNESLVSQADGIAIPFKPTTAKYFRVTLKGEASHQPWPLEISELGFSGGQRVEDLGGKIGLEKPTPATRAGLSDSDDAGAIKPDQVLNLTSSMSADGTLTWTPPAGRWTILRFGYTTTGATNHPAQPEGSGLEVDKFDAAAVESHFNSALGRVLKDAGPLAGKSFKTIGMDSWEAGTQNWSAAFPKEFQSKRGYDLLPWLPCLTGRVVGSTAQTEAVLNDFRNTLGQLYAENHYGTLRRLAHEHGLQLAAEAYNGVMDEFYDAENLDVPMAEFWVHMFSLSCRRSTSLAHTAGKQIITAEAFTARPPDGQWQENPAQLKPIGDEAWVLGVNRFALHSYVHQPRTEIAPGFTHSRYGTHFGRLNTWWGMADAWVNYIGRSQYLLQQGTCVGDVLLYRSDDLDPSSLKDEPDVPAGYRGELIASRQLLQSKIEQGHLAVPGGAAYRVLAFPTTWTAGVAELQFVQQFADAGGIIVGPPPIAPTGLVDLHDHLPQWKELVTQIWKTPDARGDDVAAALATNGIKPDFSYKASDADATVHYIHRATGDADIYFLSNQSGKLINFDAVFRVAGREPELWNAVSGEVMPAPIYKSDQASTGLRMSLDKGGSIFVVFRKKADTPHLTAATIDNQPLALTGRPLVTDVGSQLQIEKSDGGHENRPLDPVASGVAIDGPWKVSFQPGRGAPAEASLDKLVPLNTIDTFGIKYFSGVANYQTHFSLPAGPDSQGTHAMLDLGIVHDVARVSVNGKPAGIVWTSPWQIDVTPLLQAGENAVSIEVANSWVNRMIGDEQLPPDLKYATEGSKFTNGRLEEFPSWWNDLQAIKSRKRIAITTWKDFDKDSPLQGSGLVGPVQLKFYRAIVTP